MRLRALALAAVACGLAATTAPAQEQGARKPIEIFKEARDLINDGRYELAAESIKDFLGVPPTPQDYLDVESKYGASAILRLKNIPQWYDDAKKDAEFKKGPLQQLIDGSLAANAKLLRDPKRVERFVNNLGATREEYLFAIQELRRSGDFVVPIMITTLRSDDTPELRQGILSAIRELDPVVVPGILAATEGLGDDLKIGIFQALVSRPDALSLVGKVDTDVRPHLWYFASSPTRLPSIKLAAVSLLRQLIGATVDSRQAPEELVAAATPLYLGKAQFATFDNFTSKDLTRSNRVFLWEWDPRTQTVRKDEFDLREAQERVGLMYLRWAVERRPGYTAAEEMFLSLAIERGIERSNFGELAKGDSKVYRIAVSAPTTTLVQLLDTALAENRTALVLGLIQVLGDRAEKAAATAETRADGKTRQAPFVRALTYPDPRVQFAAAVALLRTPHAVPTGANARVVEILIRAIGGDTTEGPASKGKALLADPKTARSDQVAMMLRGIGYSTEQFGTGHELLRRVRDGSDFDLVLLDRHIAEPEIRDVLSQLNADANFGRRPVLVIASADQIKPVGLEPLLLRLAMLIAATETEDIPIPSPIVIDRRKSADEIAEDKRRNAEERDRAFDRLFRARLARLTRLVDASGVVASNQLKDRLALRLPQITYAGLIAEYSPPPSTAPMLYREFEKLTSQIKAQRNLDPAVENVPVDAISKIVTQLEMALTPQLQSVFEQLHSRIDREALGIRIEGTRDSATEQAVSRIVRTSPGAVVIPEPYSRVWFRADVNAAFTDPAQRPRDSAEKKATSLAAVEWLRKLAIGAVPGYDVRPAGSALKKALDSDELADGAIEALGRIPTAESQQNLLRFGLSASRPAVLRLKALDAVTRHIQTYGKLTAPEIIGLLPSALNDERNAEIKARLEAIRVLLAGTQSDLSERIKEYRPPLPAIGGSTPDPPPAAKENPPPPKGDANN